MVCLIQKSHLFDRGSSYFRVCTTNASRLREQRFISKENTIAKYHIAITPRSEVYEETYKANAANSKSKALPSVQLVTL